MTRLYRKIIKITARDSPNVRMGLIQQAAGLEPTDEIVLPGVLSWGEYQKRLATWDAVRQCIGLEAEFYEGGEVLLYPPTWLNRAEARAAKLDLLLAGKRKAEAVGVDPAEGGDSTAMAAVDRLGLIDLESVKTPDTSVIRGRLMAFLQKWDCPRHRVAIDRGGGGKQLADNLRADGVPVFTVAFGEPVGLEPRRGMAVFDEKLDVREERGEYVNRRAQMYGMIRELIDPNNADRPDGFGLPARFRELRHQLSPIPLTYDREGRLVLPPKNRPPGVKRGPDAPKTLTELIGHSPDEADALALAVYAMLSRPRRVVAGAV